MSGDTAKPSKKVGDTCFSIIKAASTYTRKTKLSETQLFWVARVVGVLLFAPYSTRCTVTCLHPAAWATCFQALHSRPTF